MKFLLTILLCVSFFSLPARSDMNVLVGISEAWQPSVFRIGIENWEFGYIALGTIGVIKVFRNDWKYMSFGPIFLSSGAGLFGSAGLETKLFWIFNFRAEIFAIGLSNSMVRGGAALALDLKF